MYFAEPPASVVGDVGWVGCSGGGLRLAVWPGASSGFDEAAGAVLDGVAYGELLPRGTQVRAVGVGH
jgi:hypothetical protein